jgi:hypothetical protein
MLTTVLGSCVAACLRDPVAGVGGMNHFLLPDGAGAGTDAGRRYGAYAMELLINELIKAGARRERLEAKLFGGGRMFDACATWAWPTPTSPSASCATKASRRRREPARRRADAACTTGRSAVAPCSAA